MEPEEDTHKQLREGLAEKDKVGRRAKIVGQACAGPAVSLIAHDWQERQFPVEGMLVLVDRVLGIKQAMQDLQWKESCHSWNLHINKVLAELRYLPSSTNTQPRIVDAHESHSGRHQYTHRKIWHSFSGMWQYFRKRGHKHFLNPRIWNDNAARVEWAVYIAAKWNKVASQD